MFLHLYSGHSYSIQPERSWYQCAIPCPGYLQCGPKIAAASPGTSLKCRVSQSAPPTTSAVGPANQVKGIHILNQLGASCLCVSDIAVKGSDLTPRSLCKNLSFVSTKSQEYFLRFLWRMRPGKKGGAEIY